MSLYRVDIKNGSEKRIFSLLNDCGFDIISTESLKQAGDDTSFRFELITPQKSLLNPGEILARELKNTDFEIHEHQGIFEKNALGVTIADDIDNNRILDYTSNKVINSLKSNGLNSAEKIREIPYVKNRMGLISDGRAFNLNQSALLDLKRDAVILTKFSEINGVPLMINTKNEDEFIRNAIALSENFFAMRISGIKGSFDIEEYSRIAGAVHIPVIFHDTMERAPTIAAVIANAVSRMKSSTRGKKAAIIGVSTMSETLVILLKHLGMERIYGIDSNPALLSKFERGEGIVASIDQAYDNSDIIIVMPGIQISLDENRLNDGQLIISFSGECVNLNKLSPAILKHSYFGYEPNPFYSLPGLASFVHRSGKKDFDQHLPLQVMNSLLLNENETGLLPRPNRAFIKKQTQFLLQ